VQEVFADAAAATEVDWRSPRATAWLYVVARRRIVDEARAGAARPRVLPLDEGAGARSTRDALPPHVGKILVAAARALPATQRTVLVMHLLEGRSFAAIAEHVRADEAACRTRYARARAHVSRALRAHGVGESDS